MSEAAIFVLVMGGMFVLRAIAATVVFCWILPEGDRCPHCDTPTLRIESRWRDRLLPWFRSSWCYRCGWEGTLRRGPLTDDPVRGVARPPASARRRAPNETTTGE